MNEQKLIFLIYTTIEKLHGYDIVVQEQDSDATYIITTAHNYRNMQAICNAIVSTCKSKKIYPCVSQKQSRLWIIVHSSCFIVHIMSEYGRFYYQIH